MDDIYAILKKAEYENLLNYLENQNASQNDVVIQLFNLNFLVSEENYGFDKSKYLNRINSIEERTKNHATYIIKAAITKFKEKWEISEKEFQECIVAIKNHIIKYQINSVLILLYSLDTQNNKWMDAIIKEHLKNVNYQVMHKDYDTSTTRYDSVNTGTSNFLQVYRKTDEDQKNDFLMKGILKYNKEIDNPTLFLKHIDPLELLCPYFLSNCYIFEYGYIIKKCPVLNESQNIVGIINDNQIVVNKNIKEYKMAEERLRDECKTCSFVYICLGQNCLHCCHESVVSCMPLRKIIDNALTRILKERRKI